MAQEFKVKNGLIVDQGGAIITGSISATGSLTVTGSTSIAAAVTDANNAPLVVQNLTAYSNPFTQYIQIWKNSAGTILSLRADGALDATVGNFISPTFSARANGSAAAPVFTRSNNVTTGIFFPTTNNIAISTNSTEVLRIFSNQNISIGTTTDSGAKLTIRGTGATSATTALRVENTNASASMVVLDNGFVGINTGSAQYNLDVNGTARFVTNDWRINNAANTRTIVVSGTNLDMAFSHGIVSSGGGFSTGNITMGSLATGLTNTVIKGFNNCQIDLNGDNMFIHSRPGTASPLRLLAGSLSSTSKGTVYVSDYANLATTVSSSAILQVDSTVQGFLPPRMTTTQKNAIATPAAGLMVYDTDLSKVNFYNGASWNNTGLGVAQVTPVTLASGSWSLVSSLYEYDYSNALITSSSIVDIIPDNSTIAIVQAAQVLPSTVSTSGSVKLFATNLPTADIIVTVNIFN